MLHPPPPSVSAGQHAVYTIWHHSNYLVASWHSLSWLYSKAPCQHGQCSGHPQAPAGGLPPCVWPRPLHPLHPGGQGGPGRGVSSALGWGPSDSDVTWSRFESTSKLHPLASWMSAMMACFAGEGWIVKYFSILLSVKCRRSAGQSPLWRAGAGSPRGLSEAGHGDCPLVWTFCKI